MGGLAFQKASPPIFSHPLLFLSNPIFTLPFFGQGTAAPHPFPDNGRLRDEEPTKILRQPASCTHFCARSSQCESARARTIILTTLLSFGFSKIRLNPA